MTDRPASAPPAPAAPALWRHGGFLKLWAGQTTSGFGTQLTGLAIPVLAISLLHATEFEVGVLGAAETIAFLVVGLPAGAWLDRWRKRRAMIAADAVRLLALAAIPLLWLAGALALWQVYLVVAVVGTATVFFDVAYQSYIPILVPSAAIGDANAKLETTSQISRIAGPAAGGGLLTVLSAPLLLAMDALSYLVSLVCVWRIRDDEARHDPADHGSLGRDIAEGLRFVAGHPLIRVITLTTALSNLFGTIAGVLLPILVLRELQLGAVGLGIIMSVGSVGGLLGALATPWLTRRIGEGRIIPVAAVISVVATAAAPLAALVAPSAQVFVLPLLVVGEFVSSFGVLTYNIAQVSFRQRVCPRRLLGRMNASIRFVVWGVLPIGSLLSGLLGQGLGIVPALWIGVVGGVLGTGFAVFSRLSRMRTLPAAEEADHAGRA